MQAGQQSIATDSFPAFDAHSDSAALATAVRSHPDDAREALGRLLSLAASPAPDSVKARHLASAARLARAFAYVWRDSFPMHQVEQFAGWTPERRAAKVAVDSLRRAGVAASRERGIAAAQRLWRASLRRAVSINDSAGEAAALGNIGAGYYLAGQYDTAATYLSRARALAMSVGDFRTAANAMTTLASVRKDQGDLGRARQLYSESRALHERIGDVGGLAADQNNLGLIAQSLGDLSEARQSFTAALAVNREYGRSTAAATNLTNLANVMTVAANSEGAARLYGEALAIYRERDDRVDAAFVLRNMALLEMRRGDYSRARTLITEALTIYESTGPVADAVDARRELALIVAAMGDLQSALTELRRADNSADRLRQSPALLAGLALARADLSVELNTLAEADQEYLRAARLYADANDEEGQLSAREGRGLLLLLRQDPDGAISEFESVARSHASAGDQRAAAATTLLTGYARAQRGDLVQARQTITRAISSFHGAGDVVGEALGLAALGEIDVDRGQMSIAESDFRSGLARLGTHLAPDVAWRLHAGLGETLQNRGAIGEAVSELRFAVGEIERTSNRIHLEERRSAFLEDKWSVYARLALAELAQHDDAGAFATSERLRARQMLGLLARGRVAPTDADHSMRSEEQVLRSRVDELTTAVLEGAGTTSLRGANLSAASLDTVREELDSALEHGLAQAAAAVGGGHVDLCHLPLQAAAGVE